MTIEQLKALLPGSYLAGAARLIDIGGGTGLRVDGMEPYFGSGAMASDLEAIRLDACKAFRGMIAKAGHIQHVQK